jgi:hypothetical protein
MTTRQRNIRGGKRLFATRRNNLFVYALCGDAHARCVNTSLQFLKKFSRQEILVVASRCALAIDHDQVIRLQVPEQFDNHQASIILKTSLHRLLNGSAQRCCYLDTDIVAVDYQVDAIFNLKRGPVSFGIDHVRMRRFSRWSVRCPCKSGECDHLRDAILTKFGVEVLEPDWQHWNGGVFLFDSESTDFLDTWHEYSRAVLADPTWKTRDQGALIAAVWRHQLQNQPPLPSTYNYIVDAMFGVQDSRRAFLGPSEYHVDNRYSLDDASELPRPHFLHFINQSLGARGWKNWDEAENQLKRPADLQLNSGRVEL